MLKVEGNSFLKNNKFTDVSLYSMLLQTCCFLSKSNKSLEVSFKKCLGSNYSCGVLLGGCSIPFLQHT